MAVYLTIDISRLKADNLSPVEYRTKVVCLTYFIIWNSIVFDIMRSKNSSHHAVISDFHISWSIAASKLSNSNSFHLNSVSERLLYKLKTN